MPRHYSVRTSSNTVGETFDALSQGRQSIFSAIPRFTVERKHRPGPAARPVSPATTLGGLLIVTGALLGCCILAGVAGLAIAAAVIIAACAAHAVVRLTPFESPRDEGTPPSTTTSFWSSLDEAEKEAFVSMARERSFARGATLFREGETADHVILIRSGWTKICVGAGRAKWLIAERGPGQLVGERAALQVNLRSASVIALETVRAYVVRTEDFAEFVGAYPRVLDIVEGQVYERLTTPQHVPHPERRAHEGPAGAGGESFNGENCTIVFTDVAGFGAEVRNDEDRRIVRRELFDMTRAAFEDAGISWESCHWEDRGDGLLIIVPPRIPTTAVLDGLPGRLAVALRRHNRRSSEPVRIQLRLAVHVGPVVTDVMGLSGEAIICAARLLDAPVLKRTLAETAANLGVIVSTFVWESVVKHGDADGFRRVRVEVKESRLDAWMCLTGRALTS